MFKVNNKVVVITGGGSGIGESLSKVFATEGAHVHILDIDLSGTVKVVSEIKAAGGSAKTHRCDVTVQSEVKAILDDINSASPVDILINNAGIGFIGNVENTTEADLDRLYSVNVKGVYNCIHCCVPLMKENGGGVIINMASIAGSLGIEDRFAYSMTKGAVLTMTYSVAKDYISYGIRCNSISPARVHTPFVDGYLKANYPGKESEMFDQLSKTQPIGRMGHPDEIAALAVYLCSDEAAFITGTDYPIDGGYIKLNG